MSTEETNDAPKGAQDAQGGESLEALAAEATRLESTPSEAEQAQQQQSREVAVQVVTSNAAELQAALTMARAMALPILPARKAAALGQVWSDPVIESVAQAGAKVLELHGVALGSLLGTYGPYIALLAAVAPPVLATRAILSQPEPEQAEVVTDGQQQ